MLTSCRDWVWWIWKRDSYRALLNEITELPIKEFGIDEKNKDILYIELEEGSKFYGYKTFPNCPEARIFNMLAEVLHNLIPYSWLGIASDIVTRYKHPQPIPLFPHLNVEQRSAYSKHATEVINDLPEALKDKLLTKFTPQKEWTVLDVGAYLGYASMRLSEEVQRVVAFECNPLNLSILNRNIEGRGNIDIVPWAAWKNRTDLLELDRREEPHSITLLGRGTGNKVNTETIDNMVKEFGLLKVDFVSYTINGVEPEALEGSINTLKRFHPVLSVTGWFKVKGQPVWKRCIPFLEGIGYKVYRFPKGRILAWLE